MDSTSFPVSDDRLRAVNHLAVPNQRTAELTVPAVQQVLEPLRHGGAADSVLECSIPPEVLDLRGAFASELAGRPPSTQPQLSDALGIGNHKANRMPLMCTLGFGPEMIDFRTVLAAAYLLGLTLVLSLAAEIGARGRRASRAKALLPLVESPKVADDAMIPNVKNIAHSFKSPDSSPLPPLR
jgi:hypothetical protein